MSKEEKKNQEEQANNQTGELENIANENAETQSELSELEAEKQKRIALMAEFDNYRKRMDAERAMFGAMANMGLIAELLEVHDDLELAPGDAELDLERAKSSIKTAQDKLTGATKNAGVEKVEVKVGDDFDSSKMEAVQAVPDEKNKGKVIAVISSAYKYANQSGILKPAKVIVGK